MFDSFATPWTVAYQLPPYMGFPRQEYWSGVPIPSPGDLPDPGNLGSSELQADSLLSEPPGSQINVKLYLETSFCCIVKHLSAACSCLESGVEVWVCVACSLD